jgi:hypothetical protein
MDLLGVCRHYRGTVERTCEAGVIMRELVGGSDIGWFTRAPCLGPGRASTGVVCEKYVGMTAEDVEAEQRITDECFRRLQAVAPIIERIKREHACCEAAGSEVCPICGAELRWRHAAGNGHVWIRCATKGCVAMME